MILAILLLAAQPGMTAQFNNQSCPLPAGAYLTTPLRLDTCGGVYRCATDGTKFTPELALVVAGVCDNDRIAIRSFE